MRAAPLLTRLRLLFLAMLLVCLGAAALFWSVQQTQFHLARAHLAHSSYEAHLALSNHTYQLFKQYGDVLIIGDRDEGPGEQALIQAIRAALRAIRAVIADEIKLVDKEETEELSLLAEIEFKIETLIRSFEGLLD